MRLSQDKARKLSMLVWRERARRWLPVAAAFAVMVALFTLVLEKQIERVDKTVEMNEREGTVTGLANGSTARGPAILSVHLDDGRDVQAFSNFRIAPPNGTHVVIAEARHASGRMTYDVVRLLDH